MSPSPKRSTPNDRRAIEADLVGQLQQARQLYDICTERYKHAIAKQDEGLFSNEVLRDPSITAAMKAQLDATERYRRALTAYNSFLLNGEFPGI